MLYWITYSIHIAVQRKRYGVVVLEEEDNTISVILPFEYDCIVESYIPCVYEVTKNDKTELYFIKLKYAMKTVSFSNCNPISTKFVMPFGLNYLFPVGKSDLEHFLAFAEEQFKKENPDYQPNCIATNLFTAIMLEYLYTLPYDKTVTVRLLQKLIHEKMKQFDQTIRRKIHNSMWINRIDWFIIIDKEIKNEIFYLQTLDKFLS